MKDAERTTIDNSEKERYLNQLDHALDVLITNLSTERPEKKELFLKEFAEQNQWNTQRLPTQESTYKRICEQVQKIREEYSWFATVIDPKKTVNSRAYFDELNVSSRSGLPFAFDIVQLHNLKKEAKETLKKTPTYSTIKKRLQHILLTDDTDQKQVRSRCEETWKQAMKRSFFEQLEHAELIPWRYDLETQKPRIEKVISLGAEELWNITTTQYSMATGMFQVYVIDVWQDIREPHIHQKKEDKVEITKELEASLKYGEDTAAWYILKTIDERFKSLHPVHISKALVGPFENKYVTHPKTEMLPLTKEILSENPNQALLRANIQYTYAPNHRVFEGETRQIIYRDTWNDEIIVTPAQYASRVAKSVLGNQVRIFES